MDSPQYEVVRTLRCRNVRMPGVLGKLATTIGKQDATIGNISTVSLGHHFSIRDIDVYVRNKEHLNELLAEIAKLAEVTVLEVRDAVLNLHEHGKIRMMNTVSVNSLDDLRKVYTPGVAEVCLLLKDDPKWKDNYTNIPYSVAIITDGTAILGLGNIGPVAGMPVMEGKAALLQLLGGVSGIPILLDTTDPDQIVETARHIAPTFGGIQLEDIASPRCFAIQERLEKEVSIPVMHDDQQGTAVVTLGSLLNAAKLTGTTLQDAKIGIIGLGAAGLTIGKFLLRYTGNPTLGTARTEASHRRHAENGGIASNLDEIMKTANIVVATSGVTGLIQPSMVRKGQIIFALSNPYPEITPQAAIAAGAALATDGRTVNNLVGYPGLWRGTLDAKAKSFTFDMYLAAANAIVKATPEGELAPNPLDPKLHLAVTHSVARAAVASGVAQRTLVEDYFESTNIKQTFG
jgi:malate dehydrogenase (oxaloacetate-decarboxylating)